VANTDKEDNKSVFVFLEDHPIGANAESIESFFGSAEPPDVVLERGRIPGQDQELGLDDLLPGPVHFLKFVNRLVQKDELIQSDPQVFPDVL